jgi:beta-1,3-galactosyltransferase 2
MEKPTLYLFARFVIECFNFSKEKNISPRKTLQHGMRFVKRRGQQELPYKSAHATNAKRKIIFGSLIVLVLIIITWTILTRRPSHPWVHNSSSRRTLVIGITSSQLPEGVKKRDAIRGTWLQWSNSNPNYLVEARFVIGFNCELNTANCTISKVIDPEIRKEFEQHQDILFVSSLDDYTHLTQKTLELFSWAHNSYKFDYLLKIDDDVFFRLDNFLKELHHNPDPTNVDYIPYTREREYRGFVWKNAKVSKNPLDKNYDPLYEKSRYPPFCAGPCYLLSSDLVSYLGTQRSLFVNYPNEDTAVGIWLQGLDVKIINDFRIQNFPQMCFPEMLSKHPVSPTEQKKLYSNLLTNRNFCFGMSSSACPLGSICSAYQTGWAQTIDCNADGMIQLEQKLLL